MPRPTTRGLAAAAGVSRTIVDRVLDRRDGVRHQTVARVEEVVRWIGIVWNGAAANLARKTDYAFVFVLPARSDGFVSLVTLAVTEAARAMRHDRLAVSLLRVRMGAPHVLVRTMTALIEDGVDGQAVDGIAVMAPETAQIRDAIHRARERGVAVITFVSDRPSAERDRFVGIDDRAAGRTAATRVGRFSRRETDAVVGGASTK